MAPPRRSLRLARELVLDPTAKIQSHHVSKNVLRHLGKLADEKATCGDHDCLRIARLCCRIAGRLKTNEARSRSFATLAGALWCASRLDHAERALQIGMSAAPPFLKSDLIRRRSFIRLYQGRPLEAEEDAEAAVALAKGADRTSAVGVLGAALYYNGKHRRAIQAFARCLELTDPDSPIPYNNALQNYATSLAKGTPEEATEAMRLVGELRERLKHRHKMQRAKLWWTEGLLHEKLGDAQAAWWALNTAWRSLVAMEAAPEVAAIVADMARVADKPFAVQALCEESAEVVSTARTLREPLRALADAAREMIPEAAAALRQAACRLAPCPAV